MFGIDQLDGLNIHPSKWVYQLKIANGSSVSFEEVVIVYTRQSLIGSIFLSTFGLPPQTLAVFNLCECEDLEGFVVGLFWRDVNGELLSGIFPDTGYNLPLAFEETPEFIEIPPNFTGTWV